MILTLHESKSLAPVDILDVHLVVAGEFLSGLSDDCLFIDLARPSVKTKVLVQDCVKLLNLCRIGVLGEISNLFEILQAANFMVDHIDLHRLVDVAPQKLELLVNSKSVKNRRSLELHKF